MNILTYLDAKQLFKDQALMVCKRVYEETWLIKEITMRHLGVIDDYFQEQAYVSSVVGVQGTRFEEIKASMPTSLNYESRQQFYDYMRRFARKNDYKLPLFGYQSIGGQDMPIIKPEPGMDAS